mgnify:CR=1 FL=1
MDTTSFEALVLEALDTLPPEFARYLENVEIQVAQQPSPAQRRAVRLAPSQTLYGLYEGVPLTERSSGALIMPDLITIFQEPLERDFPSRDALSEFASDPEYAPYGKARQAGSISRFRVIDDTDIAGTIPYLRKG